MAREAMLTDIDADTDNGTILNNENCEDLELGSPDMTNTSDRENLIKRQTADDSLTDCLTLARANLRGYGFRDGVLVNRMLGDMDEEVCRIVVPRSDRQKLLQLAHERGGHLGAKKVRLKLNRLFTWPGMSRDVANHVASCDVCRRMNKAGDAKVKLIERPVVSEPFRSVSVDLVGPLPKGRGGACYLMTYSCMATRWPEAIPLKGLSAPEVAEAFINIACRTGLPDVVVSDQGLVYTSKTFKKVCEMIGCGQVLTTPYHPQGNEVVERLHSTLKPMLAKACQQGMDWVRFLPVALFALRQMPHGDTALSPFDLVYGFDVRGPLDLSVCGLDGWCRERCSCYEVGGDASGQV